MTPADLIKAFETLADAPEGVARLRELVLQLALRGKLVSQDPDDEPASVLLKNVTDLRARLAKKKEVKKPKKLPPVSDDEVSFSLPTGWSWARLDGIAALINGDRGKNYPSKAHYVDEGLPFINAGHLRDGQVDHSEMNFISQERFDLLRSGKVQAGDLLYCLRGSLGKAAVVSGFNCGAIASSLLIIRLIGDLNPRFMFFVLVSSYGGDLVRKYDNGSAQPNLSAGNVAKYAVPIPPLAEQHRIVARVDELMGLLNRLEAAREARDTTRAAARDAALAELREADTPEDVEVAWGRFAERMDDLLTDPADVEPLRQTVLQLAVRGRLVPQDPNDEPASVLLKRIAEEKVRLAKAKKIKKPKEQKPLAGDALPFELPSGWCAVPFGMVFYEIFTGPFGTSLKKAEYITGGTPVINPQNMKNGGILPTEDTCVGDSTLKRLSGFRVSTGDLVVARRGEMGRCAAVTEREDGWLCGTGSLVLRPPPEIDTEFTARFLCSPWTVERLGGDSVGATMKNLNQRIMVNLPFGLPPLEEQHRIVAKVDELMALIDRLAERLTATQETQAAFAAAAVHHLDA